MKKVRINMSGFTRVSWSAVLMVPSHPTHLQLEQLKDLFEDKIDSGEYELDSDYWDQGETTFTEVPDDDVSQVYASAQPSLRVCMNPEMMTILKKEGNGRMDD